MPSIKDFKKNNSGSESPQDVSNDVGTHASKPKRRPGRDERTPLPESTDDVKVVDVETGEVGEISASTFSSQEAPVQEQISGQTLGQTLNQEPQSTAQAAGAQTESEPAGPKVEIKFSGSEILRAKFPKSFEIAESIATDWVYDGRFEDLPLGHPLAQYFAAKGLKKAKELERKVMESPVTEKVAMQALQAGMKAQEIISQVRTKIKNQTKN